MNKNPEQDLKLLSVYGINHTDEHPRGYAKQKTKRRYYYE
jgi:hypothetical protein